MSNDTTTLQTFEKEAYDRLKIIYDLSLALHYCTEDEYNNAIAEAKKALHQEDTDEQ